MLFGVKIYSLQFFCGTCLLQLNAVQGLSHLGGLLSKLESTGMIVSTFLYRYRVMVLSVLFIEVICYTHTWFCNGHIFCIYGVHVSRIWFRKLAPVSCIKNLIIKVSGTRKFLAPETFKTQPTIKLHNCILKVFIMVLETCMNLHQSFVARSLCKFLVLVSVSATRFLSVCHPHCYRLG